MNRFVILSILWHCACCHSVVVTSLCLWLWSLNELESIFNLPVQLTEQDFNIVIRLVVVTLRVRLSNTKN